MGLSGAGKSTVGAILADRLGYGFIDLDARVEALAGQSVERIFARGGETRFRELEAVASRDAMAERAVVVAAGGGWMARTDLERARRGCTRVWLRVRPETAIHRLRMPGSEARPLLSGTDPAEDLRELLSRREAAYSEAEVSIDTDELTPEEVAERVLACLDEGGGRPVSSQRIERES